MTPKEKAIELIDKYINLYPSYIVMFQGDFDKAKKDIKQCALIAVNEILLEYQSMSDLESKIIINDEVRFVVNQLQYWMEVKQEIEKL